MKKEELLKKLNEIEVEDVDKKRLIEALIRTTQIPVKDTNYLDATLRQRLAGIDAAGSWFEDMKEEELLEQMISPEMPLSQFTPEGAVPGCTYYMVNIPGKNGIVFTSDLPNSSPLYLSIAHAGTGRFDVVTTAKVPAKDENKTTIILGEKEGIGEVMYTLHPGLPVAPSTLTLDGLLEKKPEFRSIIEAKSKELIGQGRDRDEVILQITREQAKTFGFDMAKLASDSLARKLQEQSIDVRNCKEYEEQEH